MNTNNLPPLPVTNVAIDGLWEEQYGPYTADQMREYGQLCLKQALQQAEPQGICCYGGKKTRQACASCGAWKPEPQAQAGEPEVPEAPCYYDNQEASAWQQGYESGLQAHREAMADMRQVVDALLLDQKRNQVRTAKKDAALKAQNDSLKDMVEMMDSGNEPGAGSPWHTKAQGAITQAQGAMK